MDDYNTIFYSSVMGKYSNFLGQHTRLKLMFARAYTSFFPCFIHSFKLNDLCSSPSETKLFSPTNFLFHNYLLAMNTRRYNGINVHITRRTRRRRHRGYINQAIAQRGTASVRILHSQPTPINVGEHSLQADMLGMELSDGDGSGVVISSNDRTNSFGNNEEEGRKAMNTEQHNDLPQTNVTGNVVQNVVDNITIEHDCVWEDSVAEATLSITPSFVHNLELAQQVHTVDERLLRRLIRGKTMEALSFMMGSNALKVLQYEAVRDSLNNLTSRLEESSFPAYKTLLYNSLHILKSSVFVRHCTVEALIDTSRAGVQQRFIEQELSGIDPKVSVTVVFPSSWGAKDLLLYGNNIATIDPVTQYPRVTFIEYSPIVRSLLCRALPNAIFEVRSGSPGPSTGELLQEGCMVLLTLSGQKAASAFHQEADVQIEGRGRRIKTTLR